MLTYEIDKTSSEPIYVQICQKIKSDIENGIISPGERLPSKRTFAVQIGISVITIENAYSQLLAEGYVKSIPKKGYFVEKIERNPNTKKNKPTPTERIQDDGFETENELFPFTVWAKLMREVLSGDQQKLLTKLPFEGAYELRKAISGHLKQFRNICAAPEQIIVGAGTEYLYMLINLLFGSNYIFAVEEPGYFRIADVYADHNIKCERIPVLADGIDMDCLRKLKADIIHISPSHHFPTGAVTSIGKRYLLLEWASHSPDRYIIEDDYDSEFRLSGKPIPSLYSIDVMDKVIYMNTFSKSLSSNIRISYMVLPPDILEKFREKLGFYSCSVSAFEQYTLAKFISEGFFEKHINRMRTHYRKCREIMFGRMKNSSLFDGAVISGENAGLHCVVKFCTDMPDELLLEKVTQLGFKAALMKKYYFNKVDHDLHTLIFFYS